jgi:nitrogen fixation protein NifB
MLTASIDKMTEMEDTRNRHPCLSVSDRRSDGRIHLPVSSACNIRCRFCERGFDAATCSEQRPGVAARLLSAREAVEIVGKALAICPEISVAGIAGPGDALASPHAMQTFAAIHKSWPGLILCLSTNGLLLERHAQGLWDVGVRTITVTANAVDAGVLSGICSSILLDGVSYEGAEGACRLISAQQRGVERMANLGCVVKINTVLVPGVNDRHIEDVARAAKAWGASLINIIPLIPRHEMAGIEPPSCEQLNDAREAAEKHLPVFRHCQHCRADACGIPGESDIASLLYGISGFVQTFSHG